MSHPKKACEQTWCCFISVSCDWQTRRRKKKKTNKQTIKLHVEKITTILSTDFFFSLFFFSFILWLIITSNSFTMRFKLINFPYKRNKSSYKAWFFFVFSSSFERMFSFYSPDKSLSYLFFFVGFLAIFFLLSFVFIEI